MPQGAQGFTVGSPHIDVHHIYGMSCFYLLLVRTFQRTSLIVAHEVPCCILLFSPFTGHSFSYSVSMPCSSLLWAQEGPTESRCSFFGTWALWQKAGSTNGVSVHFRKQLTWRRSI